MICCDQCQAWQHNTCMGLSEDEDECPDSYFCEQCKPQDHEETLASIARGEKPWEERAKQRELEEQENKGRKRKGKKGKKGRVSEVKKGETKRSDNVASSPVPAETPKVEAGQKRKLAVEPTSESKQGREPVSERTCTCLSSITNTIQEPQSKVRKVSSPVEPKAPQPPPPAPRRKSTATTPTTKKGSVQSGGFQAELVERVEDLQHSARRKIASALVTLFVDGIKHGQKEGSFKLPPGQTPDVFGTKLGLLVEQSIYFDYWGYAAEATEQYKEKYRTINHNIKANPELRDRLLNGSLAPKNLSKMSSADMASKAKQEQMAKMKKEAEKQHVIVQEEGPRIRRTHKGEELVGDDTQAASVSDSVFAPAPVRRRQSELDPSDPKQGSPAAAGSPTSPEPVEPSNGATRSPPAAQPLTVDTNARPVAGLERQSSTPFNINNVWSSVSGPTTDGQHPASHRQHNQQRAVQADAEIDHLLKDEEPEDEEPYSPKDYTADPNAPVWRGKLGMAIVAEFDGTAKHVAGANLSSRYPWSQLVPTTLAIEGRIDIARASEYLCGLKYSNTTDVSVLAVTSFTDDDSQAHFNKLFEYFTERNRYGVISTNPISAVKDTYVVPLEAGLAKKPDFISQLEYCTIPDDVPQRMLLLTYVIRALPESQSAQATPHNHLDGGAAASPGTPAQQQGAFPANPASLGPQPSPYPGSMHPTYNGSPAQPMQPFMPPPHMYQPPPSGPVGMEAARQALGELADAPSVGELIKEAPNTGIPEFQVIRQLLEAIPRTREDFAMLREMLTVKHQQAGR